MDTPTSLMAKALLFGTLLVVPTPSVALRPGINGRGAIFTQLQINGFRNTNIYRGQCTRRRCGRRVIMSSQEEQEEDISGGRLRRAFVSVAAAGLIASGGGVAHAAIAANDVFTSLEERLLRSASDSTEAIEVAAAKSVAESTSMEPSLEAAAPVAVEEIPFWKQLPEVPAVDRSFKMGKIVTSEFKPPSLEEMSFKFGTPDYSKFSLNIKATAPTTWEGRPPVTETASFLEPYFAPLSEFKATLQQQLALPDFDPSTLPRLPASVAERLQPFLPDGMPAEFGAALILAGPVLQASLVASAASREKKSGAKEADAVVPTSSSSSTIKPVRAGASMGVVPAVDAPLEDVEAGSDDMRARVKELQDGLKQAMERTKTLAAEVALLQGENKRLNDKVQQLSRRPEPESVLAQAAEEAQRKEMEKKRKEAIKAMEIEQRQLDVKMEAARAALAKNIPTLDKLSTTKVKVLSPAKPSGTPNVAPVKNEKLPPVENVAPAKKEKLPAAKEKPTPVSVSKPTVEKLVEAVAVIGKPAEVVSAAPATTPKLADAPAPKPTKVSALKVSSAKATSSKTASKVSAVEKSEKVEVPKPAKVVEPVKEEVPVPVVVAAVEKAEVKAAPKPIAKTATKPVAKAASKKTTAPKVPKTEEIVIASTPKESSTAAIKTETATKKVVTKAKAKTETQVKLEPKVASTAVKEKEVKKVSVGWSDISESQLEAKTIPELKAFLKALGQPQTGKKGELVQLVLKSIQQ